MPEMESFELIDNFFQIVVLLCAAAAAGIFALRRRSRDLLILSLAYACFAMGTIYYVLYLVIIGIWPVSYTHLDVYKRQAYVPRIKATSRGILG